MSAGHVLSLIKERRFGGTEVCRWTCTCGKTGRRWYVGPGLAELAGRHHMNTKQGER